MPGPVIPKPTSLFPDWVKPENASVFDPGWRGPLRTLIGLLGLDDPNQVMMVGAAMEAGSPGGGMLEKLAKKFPRFAKAIKQSHAPESPLYRGVGSSPTAVPGEGGSLMGGMSVKGTYASSLPNVAESYAGPQGRMMELPRPTRVLDLTAPAIDEAQRAAIVERLEAAHLPTDRIRQARTPMEMHKATDVIGTDPSNPYYGKLAQLYRDAGVEAVKESWMNREGLPNDQWVILRNER